jgi:transglutaminase-like putative cysteine protease
MTRFRVSLGHTPTTEPRLAERPFNLLCLSMAFVLATHATHLPWWFSLALAATLAWRWWHRRHGGRPVSMWIKLPVVGLLLAVVIATYGTLFGREPGSAFAAGLLVLKTLETEHRRDARVGVAFGGFALMSALLFNQSMVATVVVALGLVPALGTLRAIEEISPPRDPWRAELKPALLMLAASIPLAAFAFLFIPRLESPLWGAANAGKAVTGLSSTMSPGEMGELLVDDTPAMRVTFDGPVPTGEGRYFRAYTMLYFDGRQWSQGFISYPPVVGAATGNLRFSYHVTMEPTQQRILPMLDMPMAAPADAALQYDRTVLANQRVQSSRTYDATAFVNAQVDTDLSPALRRAALQLPPGVGPQARAMAEAWATQYNHDAQAIASAALGMFRDGGYRYTLAPAPLGADRIDDFLFGTREGFCEYYASSFTFLMRAAGVPARVVTGYQGGYWNSLGNYLLVRRADSHAWTELWIAGRGWVRFDPTGAVRPERVSQGAASAAAIGNEGTPFIDAAWLHAMRDRWDVVNQWWNQAVNGFDALRQRGMLQPFGIRRADVGDLAVILAVGCSLLVAAALGWALFQRREGDALDSWMRRLQRKLARAGVTRRTGEGPRHFMARAARSLPAHRNALERLSELYLRSRYAHDEPPPELVKQFRQGVREFRARGMVK